MPLSLMLTLTVITPAANVTDDVASQKPLPSSGSIARMTPEYRPDELFTEASQRKAL